MSELRSGYEKKNAMNQDLRLQRKLAGLCPTCGGVADRKDFYECSACAKKNKIKRQSRIENGICIKCGKPNSNKKSVCDICTNKRREERKKYRKQRIELGMCTQCGTRKVAPGKKRCEICLAYQAEFAVKKFESLSDDEKNLIRKKKRIQEKIKRDEARRNGLCVKCHTRKPAYGHSACIECLTKFRRSNKKRIANKEIRLTYEECIEQGICTTCRINRATHKKLCEICYNKNLQNLQKANEAKKYLRNYWFQDNKKFFLTKGFRENVDC